jgi:uncharacterized protein YgiM (DUF1202 family)
MGNQLTSGQGSGAMALRGILLLAIGTCSSCEAPTSTQNDSTNSTDTAYVAARSLNCRFEANPSSRVRTGLRRAERVTIVDRSEGWSKIEHAAGACWVSTALLSDEAPANGRAGGGRASPVNGSPAASSLVAAGGSVALGTPHKASASRRRAKKTHSTRKSRPNFYDGGACPCSGRNVCIGPRGGRYCITRGGNKRYGV